MEKVQVIQTPPKFTSKGLTLKVCKLFISSKPQGFASHIALTTGYIKVCLFHRAISIVVQSRATHDITLACIGLRVLEFRFRKCLIMQLFIYKTFWVSIVGFEYRYIFWIQLSKYTASYLKQFFKVNMLVNILQKYLRSKNTYMYVAGSTEITETHNYIFRICFNVAFASEKW